MQSVNFFFRVFQKLLDEKSAKQKQRAEEEEAKLKAVAEKMKVTPKCDGLCTLRIVGEGVCGRGVEGTGF